MPRDRRVSLHYYEWDVARWSTSQTRDVLDATGRGIYRELLDRCYIQGSIPADPVLQSGIAACTVEQMERYWPLMKHHFRTRKNAPGKLENPFANVFRKQFYAYTKQQAKNRSNRRTHKSNADSDIRNDGCTDVQRSSNLYYKEKNIDIDTKEQWKGENHNGNPPPLPSAVEPFDHFREVFVGAIPDTTWRVFGAVVQSVADLHAVIHNTRLWMRTKRYADGFHDAEKFLRSGVWRRPPPAKLLQGNMSKAERAMADYREEVEREEQQARS